MGKGQFAKEWVRLRTEDGFKSARDFYMRSGGRKVLQLSYVNYWEIEKGRILPRPERISVMMACLRKRPETIRLQRLLRAYLEEHLGSENACQWILETLARKIQGRSLTPGQKAMSALYQKDTYHLSPEESDTIHKSYAAYWIWNVLSDDSEDWEPKRLARLIGASAEETAQAISALSRKKLVRAKPNGRLYCPLAGKHFSVATRTFTEKDPTFKYHARMISRGQLLRFGYRILRADEGDFQSYYPYLEDAIRAASTYSTREKTNATALFIVKAAIHRLLKY